MADTLVLDYCVFPLFRQGSACAERIGLRMEQVAPFLRAG